MNSSFSKEISNPCKPGQKSFVAGLFDSKQPKVPAAPERAKVSDEKQAKPDESKVVKDDEPSEEEESVVIGRESEQQRQQQDSYRDDKVDSPPERLCFIKEQVSMFLIAIPFI